MNKKVIVIGTGFGGLGAAARLAARGYQVELFEKRDKPGGRGYDFWFTFPIALALGIGSPKITKAAIVAAIRAGINKTV